VSGLDKVLITFFNLPLIRETLSQIVRIGLRNTLILAVLAIAAGLLIGVVVALGLLSSRRSLRVPSRIYVDIFRGLPSILTIYLLGEGLPLAGLDVFAGNTYGYAALALGMIEGAYIAEILRAGIQSVDRGQSEAARSLGLSGGQAMRLVVFPQGVRRVLPPLAGQFIIVTKATALVYLLGLTASQREMFAIGQDMSVNNASLSPLVAVGLSYLALTVPLTYLVNRLDRRLRAGPRRAVSTAPARLVQDLG